MLLLKEVLEKETAWIKSMGGFWAVTEGDWKQNKFSRSIVRAYRREHGQAWLGKINLYGEERHKDYHLTEYKKGMVFNFEYSFAVPCKDAELERLIIERDNAAYEGTASDIPMVERIMTRITELGGVHLRWV